MAALTATDWTVSIEDRGRHMGGKKRYRCKLTLATAGSYPSGGVPIPSLSNFGFVKQLDNIIVFDQLASSASYIVKYDQAAKSIRIYSTTASITAALNEVATTVTVGAASFVLYVEAVGW